MLSEKEALDHIIRDEFGDWGAGAGWGGVGWGGGGTHKSTKTIADCDTL